MKLTKLVQLQYNSYVRYKPQLPIVSDNVMLPLVRAEYLYLRLSDVSVTRIAFNEKIFSACAKAMDEKRFFSMNSIIGSH